MKRTVALLLISFLSGCHLGCELAIAQQEVPDMAVPQPYGVCRGPQDKGKLMWWDGRFDPVPFPERWGVRYECRDHGSERDGWWFEAIPEERAMP